MKAWWYWRAQRLLSSLLAVLVVCSVLVACDDDGGSSDDDEEDPSRSLRLVNAVPGSVSIGWEIDDSDQGTVAYGRASAPLALIDGEKPLTFYQIQADGDLDFFDLTFDYDVDGDDDVLIVLSGSLDDIRLDLIEVEGFDLDEDFGRVGVINLTSAYDSLDVYLTDAQDGVFSENPLTAADTLQFQGMFDIEEGDWELQFTRVGEKDIVFDAGDVDIDEDTNHFYLAMDFSSGSESLLVLEIQGDGTTRQLVDDETPARLRLFNGIADYPSVDLYFGNTSGEPVFQGIEFQTITDYIDIDPDTYSVNVTPSGVVDTFFYEAQLSVTSGNYLTLVLAGLVQGDDGSIDIGGNLLPDAVQSIDGGAQVSFVHASKTLPAVDVFVLLPGQPVDDASAVVTDLSSFSSFEFEQEPGDYLITLVQSSNEAVILGPTPITFSNGEVIEIYYTESAGGGTPGALTVVQTAID